MTHICVGNLTIIDSDTGLALSRRQAITWTNAGLLLIRPWGTNFSEILIGIQTFSFKNTHLKMSSAKWCFCLGLNGLTLLVPKYEYSRQTRSVPWLLMPWLLLCQFFRSYGIDSLVQDCSNTSALAMELLQSCTKPSMYIYIYIYNAG